MPVSPSSFFGPPVAKVIRLTDFEAANALFPRWQGRFEQISNGRFAGALKVVRGSLIRVMEIEANQRVVIRGNDTAGLLTVYPVTVGNAASLWQGHRLDPGRLVVTGVQAEVDHLSSRMTTSLGVSLSPEALQEAARTLLATDVVALPRSWAAVSPPTEVFVGLNRQLTRLLNVGVANPSLLGTSEGDRFEQECVRSMVASLFSTATPQMSLSLPARVQLIRRAEEFMRVRLAQPIAAIDICREFRVSDRTLRLAFRERYGIGPMAYYKILRLNAVRTRLRSDSLVLVAVAAQAYGFHHLGNFAADYRRLFGERPSETERG